MNTLKSVCYYHPDQAITNFCKDSSLESILENCLMPLCPSCIGEHSMYHEQSGSKPQYHNIYETLTETQTMLYNSIYALEVDKKRIVMIYLSKNELVSRINSVNDLVINRLAHAKNIVFSIVEQVFKDLESQLKASLSHLHEEIGLFSSKKTEKLQEGLKVALTELYEINQGLKGEKYLGHLIVFLKQKQKESAAFHSKLTSYLDSNENYTPKIQISNQATTSLANCLSRIIKTEAKKDYQRRKQSIYEPKNTNIAHKKSFKDVQDKTQKIERSYTPQRSSTYAKSTIQPQRSRPGLVSNNSPYTPMNGYSPLRERVESTLQRQYPAVPTQPLLSHFNHSIETSRIRDFKQQFQLLSRKVSQMRKQNQIVTKAYR